MLVDVKLLTLLCVLKDGSYTAAAEALALSQPAVSYHIHQLEQEFHIKIFYRNPKKLTLTPEGKVLVKYAKRLVNISEAARRALVSKGLFGEEVFPTPTADLPERSAKAS